MALDKFDTTILKVVHATHNQGDARYGMLRGYTVLMYVTYVSSLDIKYMGLLWFRMYITKRGSFV